MKTKILFYLGLLCYIILNSCSTNRVISDKIANNEMTVAETEIDKPVVTYLYNGDKIMILDPKIKFPVDDLRVLIVDLTGSPNNIRADYNFNLGYSGHNENNYQTLSNFDSDWGWRLKYHSENSILKDTVIENQFYTNIVINELAESISSKAIVLLLNESVSAERMDSIVKGFNINLVITLDSMRFKYIFDYSGYKNNNSGFGEVSPYIPGMVFTFDGFGYSAHKNAYTLKHTVIYNAAWDLFWVDPDSKGISREQKIEQIDSIVNYDNPIPTLAIMSASRKSGNDFASLFK